MSIVRIIGDVHGKVHAYLERIKEVEYSIQLGDFGFAKEWAKLVTFKVNPNHHKIIPGNHDDYRGIKNFYTFGEDYGYAKWKVGGGMNPQWFEFFMVRGAYSIDQKYRTPGVSWWEEEEISYNELQKAIDQYQIAQPEVVLTHDCPGGEDGVSSQMFNLFKGKLFSELKPNRTATALEEMFNIHKPKLWIFGHWHETKIQEIQGTTFVALDELDYVDYDTEKTIEENIKNMKKQILKFRKKLRY